MLDSYAADTWPSIIGKPPFLESVERVCSAGALQTLGWYVKARANIDIEVLSIFEFSNKKRD